MITADSVAPQLPDVPDPSSVVTAVIDTGVFPNHPGLIGNQLPGKDFLCGHSDCSDPPDDDRAGHGTNMAGVIAARDAERGVYGVAWNTHFIPLRAFGHVNTDSDDLTVSSAIRWAVDMRADVINLSWSSPRALPRVEREIRNAERNGVLVVVAAGNGGFNIDDPGHATYPARYRTSNMIVVMAHIENPGRLLASSNWGEESVDVSAPGSRFTAAPCAGNRCYRQTTGSSSIATAYVSGAAALVKSVHRDWTAGMLKTHLIESSLREPWLEGKSRSGARLTLDRALNGPLRIIAPAAGAKWSSSRPQTVRWSNEYPSSLCNAIQIGISVDGSAGRTLASGLPNDGEAEVSLDWVPQGRDAVISVSCPSAGFSAVSGQFIVAD